MKEWKIRQTIYHKTEQPYDIIDAMAYHTAHETEEDLVQSICDYFTKPLNRLEYPAKSYAVAIIYATLLEKHFREDFVEALNDPHLLYDNDYYFVPYSKATSIYNSVLSRIDRMHLNVQLPQIKTTVNCFEAEFMLSSPA